MQSYSPYVLICNPIQFKIQLENSKQRKWIPSEELFNGVFCSSKITTKKHELYELNSEAVHEFCFLTRNFNVLDILLFSDIARYQEPGSPSTLERQPEPHMNKWI